MAEPFVTGRMEADHVEQDGGALRSWHETHSDWLRGYLRRSLRLDAAEADDIVQDTWLRVIRKSLADVEHPRAYLSRIALNLLRDRRRHDRVQATHRHLVLASDRDRIDPGAMTEQEASRELERAILDLPEPVRDVFVLSRFRHLSNKDIAAHFGISVKTVEWRIGKAIDLCAGRLKS